ncbi:Uncharacterized membrane protein [Ceraceosorus bombacis]|uniref:Uncharacterized membrane protein n=1 Tax=Ceraceosorus bombacis TaxID=401625 RepID=A0A0P1B7T9_9BASI|nr:Uncharacterized membrane protein [Ceraceosorus bombacis]
MSSTQREYDVVVLGATGFTGSLVAEYLARHPTHPRWGIAGRSAARLDALRKKLDLPTSVGILSADTTNIASLQEVAKKTKVLANIAGPFRKTNGYEVAKACASVGTHYTDLSGESGFNASLLELGPLAASTGSILVPSSGFDSLPLDLSAYFAAQHLKKSQGVSHVDTTRTAVRLDGGFSTGTILSAVDAAEIDGGQLQFEQPDQLSPVKGTHIMPFDVALRLPQFGPNVYGSWFPLTPHNHRVINQTWGLLQVHSQAEAYGQDFAYHEASLLFPPKRVPWPLSYLLTSFLSLFFVAQIKALIWLAPVRWALRTFLPQNGGPSKKGFADVRALATGKDKQGNVKQSICKIFVQDSPGYHATARMISETALHLASTSSATTKESSIGGLRANNFKGGILTTATIGAEALRDRLTQYAGMTFDVGTFDQRKVDAVAVKSRGKDL